MEVYVLDRYYNTISVIDAYVSMIWTERFRETGDFELYVPWSIQAWSALQKENYISIRDSETYMVIDSVETSSSPSDGVMMIVKGRCLKSILRRRVVWAPTVLQGNLQDAIEKVLNENAISPTDERRKIPNLTFKRSTDPRITAMETDTVFFGENVDDVIRLLCAYHSIGWKVLPTNGGGFEVQIFDGEDRSYEQEANPWVVFSKNYENLFSSRFFTSNENVATAALVTNDSSLESETALSTEATDQNGGGSGLDRREMFVETYDVGTTDEEGNEIPEADRIAQLVSKGEEALAEVEDESYVEGDIDAVRQYVYGRDFFMGDIVQIDTEFGLDIRCRIMEVVRCQDEKGYAVTPTFATV